MAELLKNYYNEKFIDSYINALSQVYPTFNGAKLINDIFDEQWESKELKQRMRHISMSTITQLPPDFKSVVSILKTLALHLQKSNIKQSFEYMFIPEIIELMGLPYPNLSLAAFETITQYTSCEFAIRPFIIKYPEQVLAQMLVWSSHEHQNVRRFSSEGCRPRLPWAMGIPTLKTDPFPILPILENLKNDSSVFVQKSVANNLNDISKDHPDLVIKTVKKWIGHSKSTDWIIKHASRTLLKQGNQETMLLFGFGSTKEISLSTLIISNPIIKLGQNLDFSFQIQYSGTKANKFRLEYGIYYQKANGTLSKKVFKISERILKGNEHLTIHKKQHFKPITTRKYHSGLHQISIIINGIEMLKKDFELLFV